MQLHAIGRSLSEGRTEARLGRFATWRLVVCEDKVSEFKKEQSGGIIVPFEEVSVLAEGSSASVCKGML